MTEEQIALAKRAVVCKGFRWMPGMAFDLTRNDATSTGWRITSVQHGYFSYWASEVVVIKASVCEFVISPRGNVHVRYAGRPLPDKSSGCRMLPDLTDPATLGCLLALVREAWNEESIGFVRQECGRANGGPRWFMIDEGGERGGYHPTEAEALVAALEAAP